MWVSKQLIHKLIQVVRFVVYFGSVSWVWMIESIGLLIRTSIYFCTDWLIGNLINWFILQGVFLHNMLQQQRTIVNAIDVNEDGVAASGGDNGSLW